MTTENMRRLARAEFDAERRILVLVAFILGIALGAIAARNAEAIFYTIMEINK